MARLIPVDRYSAVSAEGIVAFQPYIVVDALPVYPEELSPGDASVPMSIYTSDENLVHELVVIGWGIVGAEKRLYITAIENDYLGPITVLCAPSRSVVALLQPAESHSTNAGPGTYVAHVGVMHHLTVLGNLTIQLSTPTDFPGWTSPQAFNISSHGLVTRLFLHDVAEIGPPVLTWSGGTGIDGVAWEGSIEPQFAGAGGRLLVELWSGADGFMYGWSRQF